MEYALPYVIYFISATTAAVEGKLSKPLKKVLKKIIASEAHEKLAVADAKLGQAIKVFKVVLSKILTKKL